MTVIAAVLGAIPDGADLVYVPVEEGVSGRNEEVAAIAVFHSEAPPSIDGTEAYRVDEHVQWDDGPRPSSGSRSCAGRRG